MTPSELHQSVARATGESLEVVDALGFQHHRVPMPRFSTRWADRILRLRKLAKILKRKGRPRKAATVA